MPYINRRNRRALNPYLETLIDCIDTPGEANYAITRILTEASPFIPVDYGRANTALGVLSAVSHEYYRRVVAPYENRKWAEHGDIPGFTGVSKPRRATGPTQADEDDLT